MFDLNPDAAREWGERLGVPWTTSYDELLERCDAVAVATPTGTHAELVTTAAWAGRPVFCEKPISSDRATTLDVLDAVAAAGVPLQVGFHRRFDPDWVSVAQRLPELGEITLFRTSLRDMTPPPVEFIAGSGGFFADVTVHDLDVARWLVGEVVEVSAHGAASDPAFAEVGDIDTAVVVLTFASGRARHHRQQSRRALRLRVLHRADGDSCHRPCRESTGRRVAHPGAGVVCAAEGLRAALPGLVTKHQDFDVIGRVGPGEQRQPAQHTGEHQVRESKRHSERSCWPRSGLRLRAPLGPKVLIKGRWRGSRHPQGHSCFAVLVDHVPAAAQAARTAWVSCGVACSGHGPRNLAAMMTRRSLTVISS